MIGGMVVVAFALFGMVVAVADISIGSGMTLGVWLQVLGVVGGAVLIPIGGLMLRAGTRRSDRAMAASAAYASLEGESDKPEARIPPCPRCNGRRLPGVQMCPQCGLDLWHVFDIQSSSESTRGPESTNGEPLR